MELTSKTCAVIAVHLQSDIVGAEGAFAPVFHQQIVAGDIIGQAIRLVDVVRRAGGQVVFTRVAWEPDYRDLVANFPLFQMVAQAGALKEGEANSELIAEAVPQPGDLVHTHKRVGGFTSDLDDYLRGKGVDTVLFCGVATNVSLEGTARQASDAGYRVIIVSDACSAATPEAHAASLETMSLLAEVADSATVVSALGGE